VPNGAKPCWERLRAFQDLDEDGDLGPNADVETTAETDLPEHDSAHEPPGQPHHSRSGAGRRQRDPKYVEVLVVDGKVGLLQSNRDRDGFQQPEPAGRRPGRPRPRHVADGARRSTCPHAGLDRILGRVEEASPTLILRGGPFS
jgi:hypothetical protein